MASIEFIQKRIEGKEKELATLQKKLDRILKAQESNWEKNPYYYSERDLRVTQKDIEIAEAALQGYKDQLAAETEKANSRNIPIILEFLDQWKARVFAYYQEATARYNEEIVEYLRRNSEYCDWVNNGDSRQLWKDNRDEYNRIYKEYHNYEKAFKSEWNWLTPYLNSKYVTDLHRRTYTLDEEKVHKMLDQEANAKYDFIVERTNAIVGQITDASDLRIGAKGDLNGYIYGTKGTAKVQTIGAGGWNVQIFHFRTLISPVRQ